MNKKGQVNVGVAGLILAGIIALIGGVTVKKAKPRKKVFWVSGIVFAIALIGMLGGWAYFQQDYTQAFSGLQTFTIGAGTGQVVVDTTSCNKEDTTITLGSVNAITQAGVGGQHSYKVNNGFLQRVSDLGTDTVSPGDTLTVLWGNASGSFYSAVGEYTVPCAGTYTPLDNGAPVKLWANDTGFAVEIFNEEGNLIDDVGENETLGAGDVVALNSNLKGTFQTGLPYGLVIVVDYNGTTIDNVFADYGGSETEVPTADSVTATDSERRAFTIPAITSTSIAPGKISGVLTIDADDSNNPGVDGSDIAIRIYPLNYFVNEDEGSAFQLGVEDEDNALTGLAVYTDTLQVD